MKLLVILFLVRLYARINIFKIANRITKVSRLSPQINSETITDEYDKEIPKEKYISPEERQKIIVDLV